MRGAHEGRAAAAGLPVACCGSRPVARLPPTPPSSLSLCSCTSSRSTASLRRLRRRWCPWSTTLAPPMAQGRTAPTVRSRAAPAMRTATAPRRPLRRSRSLLTRASQAKLEVSCFTGARPAQLGPRQVFKAAACPAMRLHAALTRPLLPTPAQVHHLTPPHAARLLACHCRSAAPDPNGSALAEALPAG